MKLIRANLVTVLKALVQIFDITLQATLYDNLEKKNPGGSFSWRVISSNW